MATVDQEIEVLPAGSKLVGPEDGPIGLNVLRDQGGWRVRSGFGQFGQWDTGLGQPNTDGYGYEKILGAAQLRTDFGHDQHVTLLSCLAYTGVCADKGAGQWAKLCVLSVVDLTTWERHEEVLHEHTASRSTGASPLPDWSVCYEAGRDLDSQSWISGETGQPWFVPYQGTLIFGSKRLGVWCYAPAALGGGNRVQVQSHQWRDELEAPGESAVVQRIAPAQGEFGAAYAYLDTAAYPAPVDACVYDGRLVLAAGSTLWFSDRGRPQCISGLNFVSLPEQQQIAAIGATVGGILIWSDRGQAFLYQPSSGALASEGSLRRISSSMGCLGPAAHCPVDQGVAWLDRNRVCFSPGGGQVEILSADIERLFRDGLPHPVSAYVAGTPDGTTALVAEQPRIRWGLEDLDGAHLCYEPKRKLLLVVIPGQRFALCWKEGAWAIWSWESLCSSEATLAIAANIERPWLTADGIGGLFLAGGVETKSNLPDAVPRTSYYLLEYERGGGLDRAPEQYEDQRTFGGHYDLHNIASPTIDQGGLALGPPVLLPTGYTFPNGKVVGANDKRVVLYPLLLRRDDAGSPERIELVLTFDNTNWAPVRRGATAELDLILPAARLASEAGWSLGAPVAGTSEAQVYDSGTGLASTTGDQLRLRWDAVTGAAATPWSYGGAMSFPARRWRVLCWIGLETKSAGSLQTMTMHAGWATASVCRMRVGGVDRNLALYLWRHPDAQRVRYGEGTSVDQPVDWAIRTANLSIASTDQTRLRSLYLRAVHAGRATSPVVPTFVYGLLNVAFHSDDKGFASQIVDYDLRGVAEQSITANLPRARVKNTSGNLVARTFNNGSLTWGDSTDSTKGNLLADDDPVDSIAISDSVRGESVAATLFGFIRSAAERLHLFSVKAGLQEAGGRRRVGR